MDDAEAVRLCDRMWSGAEARNLLDPCAGGDATWARVVEVAEDLILSVLALHLADASGSKRAEIERRCALDGVARRASIYPTAYARPLYVSDGFLADAAAADRRQASAGKAGRKLKEPPHCREHVVPVSVHGSGKRILNDPELHLPRIRRTFLGPICYISNAEDDRVRETNVKGHDAPFHPFSRYRGIATVRRTDTGEALDPDGFTFRDHLRLMSAHPAYATAVPLFRDGAATWRRRISELRGISC
jgi:hypothetical protein